MGIIGTCIFLCSMITFPALIHSLRWSEAELSPCHLPVCSLHPFLRDFVRMGLFSSLPSQGPPPLDRAGQTLCHLQVSLLQPQPASQGTSAGARWGRASESPVIPWPGVLGERAGGPHPCAWLLIPPSLLTPLLRSCTAVRRTLKSGLTPEEARALGLVGTSELQL